MCILRSCVKYTKNTISLATNNEMVTSCWRLPIYVVVNETMTDGKIQNVIINIQSNIDDITIEILAIWTGHDEMP